MPRILTPVAFAALLAASSATAFAQSAMPTTATPATSRPAATATVHSAAPAGQMMPGQVRFSDMDGATVYDSQDKNVGDIKDLVLDQDGRVAVVVLDVGSFLGIGGKNVAVALDDLKMTSNEKGKPKFSVGMTRDQLKQAEAFDLTPKNAATGSSTPPANPPRR